ncbi:hypothetical protein HK096_001862, partial [Nowakowskiella sp. JEL0078]
LDLTVRERFEVISDLIQDENQPGFKSNAAQELECSPSTITHWIARHSETPALLPPASYNKMKHLHYGNFPLLEHALYQWILAIRDKLKCPLNGSIVQNKAKELYECLGDYVTDPLPEFIRLQGERASANMDNVLCGQRELRDILKNWNPADVLMLMRLA